MTRVRSLAGGLRGAELSASLSPLAASDTCVHRQMFALHPPRTDGTAESPSAC